MDRGLFPPARLCVLAAGPAELAAASVFAMHRVAAELVLSPTAEAVWIDARGSFSGLVLRDVVTAHLRDSADESITGDSVCDRVSVVRVFDPTGLRETVAELEKDTTAPLVLVLDSFSALFSPHTALRHREMADALAQLGDVVRARQIIAFLLSSAVSALPSDPVQSQFGAVALKPALGLSFLYTIDLCALVYREADSDSLIFEVVADRWQASEGLLLPFRLVRLVLSFLLFTLSNPRRTIPSSSLYLNILYSSITHTQQKHQK
ncbi:hypothetical protein BZA70DRAFT_176988 [Myxozyma melibiosi]|uniref:DNA recombination and repair protein Rad51-like C-terminal domain-containing protein n=1 Tax=Myxozyma melibiosi TaxID=54550 RepID=A0ABR1F5X8_9ASCO